jgi:isopentenyldiphosphate isomerase
MLIQQRQPFKEGWSNMWDISVGGSSIEGENSRTAAERELYEELGYIADLSNERPYFTINFSCGFDDFYIIEDDVDIEDLKLQYEEVQAVRWASKEEILVMIDDKTFIPYHKSVIEMVFAMRHNRGGHSE